MSDPPPGEGGGQPAPKKGLADMNKEELVAKCKGLLQIAQRAKAAKDGKKKRLLVLNLLSFVCQVSFRSGS